KDGSAWSSPGKTRPLVGSVSKRKRPSRSQGSRELGYRDEGGTMRERKEVVMARATKTARKPKLPVRKLEGPVLIYMGWDNNGCVYELHPRSEDMVKERFAPDRMLPLVFLGYEKEEDFERLHVPHLQLVGTLLTGLTLEQIAQLGGLRLYDPKAKKVMWEWLP